MLRFGDFFYTEPLHYPLPFLRWNIIDLRLFGFGLGLRAGRQILFLSSNLTLLRTTTCLPPNGIRNLGDPRTALHPVTDWRDVMSGGRTIWRRRADVGEKFFHYPH